MRHCASPVGWRASCSRWWGYSYSGSCRSPRRGRAAQVNQRSTACPADIHPHLDDSEAPLGTKPMPMAAMMLDPVGSSGNLSRCPEQLRVWRLKEHPSVRANPGSTPSRLPPVAMAVVFIRITDMAFRPAATRFMKSLIRRTTFHIKAGVAPAGSGIPCGGTYFLERRHA